MAEREDLTDKKKKAQATLFGELIKPYLKIGFPKNVVLQELWKFRSYWTELNVSGTKHRWQLQKTFELKRRFATWMRNFRERNFKQ